MQMLKLDAVAMIDERNTRRRRKVYKWANAAATGYSSDDITAISLFLEISVHAAGV